MAAASAEILSPPPARATADMPTFLRVRNVVGDVIVECSWKGEHENEGSASDFCVSGRPRPAPETGRATTVRSLQVKNTEYFPLSRIMDAVEAATGKPAVEHCFFLSGSPRGPRGCEQDSATGMTGASGGMAMVVNTCFNGGLGGRGEPALATTTGAGVSSPWNPTARSADARIAGPSKNEIERSCSSPWNMLPQNMKTLQSESRGHNEESDYDLVLDDEKVSVSTSRPPSDDTTSDTPGAPGQSKTVVGPLGLVFRDPTADVRALLSLDRKQRHGEVVVNRDFFGSTPSLTVFFDFRASEADELVRRELERAIEWGAHTVGGEIHQELSGRFRLKAKNFASQLHYGQFPYVDATTICPFDHSEAICRQKDISSDVETDFLRWDDDDLSEPDEPNCDEESVVSDEEERAKQQLLEENPRAARRRDPAGVRTNQNETEQAARIKRLCIIENAAIAQRCPYVCGYDRDWEGVVYDGEQDNGTGRWTTLTGIEHPVYQRAPNMYEQGFLPDRIATLYPEWAENEIFVRSCVRRFSEASITTAADPLLIPQAQLFAQSKCRSLLACSVNGLALRYAASSLRDDLDLVTVAVRADWRALRYASRRLRGTHRDLATTAIKQCGWALKYCSGALRADPDLVHLAVSHKPWAIQYASRKLWASRAILEAVAKRDGLPAMLYAVRNVELVADKGFVMLCASTNGLAVKYAAEELLGDRDIAKVAIEQNPYAVRYFYGRGIPEDKGMDVLIAALRRLKDVRAAIIPKQTFDTVARRHPGRTVSTKDDCDPFAFVGFPELVDFRGLLEHRCGKGCRLHRDEVGTAFKTYKQGSWWNMVFDSGKRRYDWADLEIEGTSDRMRLLEMAGDCSGRDNFEVVRLAVEHDPESLKFASLRLRADPEIVMTAVVRDAWAFLHASDTLRGDSVFFVTALEKMMAIRNAMERYYFGDYSAHELSRMTRSWRILLREFLHGKTDDRLSPPANVRADLVVGRDPKLCRRVANAMPWLYLRDDVTSWTPPSSRSRAKKTRACYTTKLLEDPSFFQLVMKAACVELSHSHSPRHRDGASWCRFGRFATGAACLGSRPSWDSNCTLLVLVADTLQVDILNAESEKLPTTDFTAEEEGAFSDENAVLDLFRCADRDLVLFSLRCCGSLLRRAGSALQADNEAVIAAVSSCGAALQYASLDLQQSRAVLGTAARCVVQQHDVTPRKDTHLPYRVNPPPRRDEIVERFLLQYLERCCSWAKEAVLDLLPDYRYLYLLLPTEELREDDDILRLVMELDEDNFIFERLPEDHKMHQSKQVVIQAVKRDPSAMLSLKRPSPFWIDEDVLAAFRERCPNPMERFMHFPAVVELTRI